MTTEQMRQALEAAGYKFSKITTAITAAIVGYRIYAPDRLTQWEWRLKKEAAIKQAYAHLQQQQELKALRDFVLQTAKTVEYIPDWDKSHPRNRAKQLIEQYTITADESDEA